MKRIGFVLSSLLIALSLSACTIIANENGVGVYGEGGSVRISSETITMILVIVAFPVLIAGGVTAALIVVFAKKIKQRRIELDQQLKDGKITKEQYDAEIAKLGKMGQRR